MYDKDGNLNPFKIIAAVAFGFATIGLLIIAMVWGAKSFGRSQQIADAHNKAHANIIAADNKVAVTKIEIANQSQQVKVTEQQADIRYRQAVGVRKAQDEIAKTLTPLYVQFEMTQALEDIAKSGKNNTVVYIPSGQGGVPTITAQAGIGK